MNREELLFVLEKGAIEKYYPAEVEGSDKPSKALSLCSLVTTSEQLKNLCKFIDSDAAQPSEFEVIMKAIFKSQAADEPAQTAEKTAP